MGDRTIRLGTRPSRVCLCLCRRALGDPTRRADRPTGSPFWRGTAVALRLGADRHRPPRHAVRPQHSEARIRGERAGARHGADAAFAQQPDLASGRARRTRRGTGGFAIRRKPFSCSRSCRGRVSLCSVRPLRCFFLGSSVGLRSAATELDAGSCARRGQTCRGQDHGPHAMSRRGRPMTIGPVRPTGRFKDELRALKWLTPYLWPRDSFELRVRVVLAVTFLLAAKLLTIYVPILYKHAIDALSPGNVVVAVPVALIVAYGFVRVMSQGFNELRTAVFAKVSQRAVRRLALSAFRHVHALSLRFHLERRTGGLSRAIERGTAGIDFLLSFMLFNVVPTLFEIMLVCAILWRLFDWTFAAVTLATIVLYIGFTFSVTDWRVRFRREMNERNTEANTKAVDGLLNFETVKYFANEEYEAQRYDSSLRAYERAAVKSETTLTLLNLGQVTIMALAARGIAAAEMTVGDFVLVNAYLIQLYTPLNFLGMVYRNIKQS